MTCSTRRTLIQQRNRQDFAGGHIRGAINQPSESFRSDAQVDAFLQQHVTENVDKVVVHCQLSQQRGPRAAARIIERLQAGASTSQPAIVVMRTGFSGFEQVRDVECLSIPQTHAQLYGGTDLVDRS